MNKEIEDRLKLNKWYLWMPIIGSMWFSLRLELFINKVKISNPTPTNKKLGIIKRYKTWFTLAALSVAIGFMVSFFVLRNTGPYGAYPWFFWVGLGFGLSQHLTPLVFYFLYKTGYKKYKAEMKK